MSSRRILARLLEEPELRLYHEKVREHAGYVEHKFRINRGRDIKPARVEDILDDLKSLGSQLEKLDDADEALSYIETISFQCEAAIMFYDDKDNPARYLETLKKKVLPLLKDF
jgi:hypothetical protein